MTGAPPEDRVLAAVAAWRFTPPGSVLIEGPDYLAVRFPDWFDQPLQLVRCAPGRDPGTVVDEVRSRCRGLDLGLDHQRIACWARLDSPPGLEEALRGRGEPDEVLDILAREVDASLDLGVLAPERDDLAVRWTDDPEVLVDAATVGAEVFGGKVPTRASVLDKAEGEAAKVRTGGGGSVVAYLDGLPVASAGVTVVGEDARLWGGATRPEHRRRGIYRALLAERLRYAIAHGALLALVKGRAQTSGPILRRAGFSPYGQERSYLLPL